MTSVPNDRQSQLAEQWHQCYADLERLAAEGITDWKNVADPIIKKVSRIEGELWRLQVQRNQQLARL